MLVHAHPDDESSATGGTMAHYAADGAAVTLVTCTLGERGEIVSEDLGHLAGEPDHALGAHRLTELATAMAELGVTDFVRLGGDGRWRDSGMAYAPDGRVVPAADVDEAAFWRADLLEAANELVPLIRARRPQVLITYDENGHYGHPDHIQANRVATYAVMLAGHRSYRRDLGVPWTVQRLLWIATSADTLRSVVRAVREAGQSNPFLDSLDIDSDQPPLMAVDDRNIDVRIDGYRYARQRFAALRAHASQIHPDDFFFHIQDAPPGPVWHECYRLAAGTPYGPAATDLFSGLDLR